ncbi:Sugar transporter STL1 [Fusarium oxysporum f. sp. albedinis]|nr:Sugar transporter STL1 [Fusarium oxysporum f. sp. albedinis]
MGLDNHPPRVISMPRERRKPACNPCRTSKLACDHEQPVCSRCRAKNRASDCIYRSRPFQKVKGSARSGFASTPAQSPVQTPVQTPVGSVYVSESPIPSSE